VTDDCDNTATAQQTVVVSDGTSLHVEIVGPGQALPNQEVTFNAIVSGGVPPYTYCWEAINGAPHPLPNDPQYNCGLHENDQIIRFELPTGSGTATVYVTVTDANDEQEVVIHNIDITANALTLDFDHYPIYPTWLPGGGSIIPGQYLYWVANVDPLLETPYPADYTWDFGDGSSPVTEPNGQLEHTFATAGTYTVTLEMCDLFGSCIPTAKTYQVGGSIGPSGYEIMPGNTTPAVWTVNGDENDEYRVELVNLGGALCNDNIKWNLFWSDCNYKAWENSDVNSSVIIVNNQFFDDISNPDLLNPWGCLDAYASDPPDPPICPGGAASNDCVVFMQPSAIQVGNIAISEAPGCVYKLGATVSGGGWKFENPTNNPNTPKLYKEYQWTAYNIDNPDEEIDILTNADTKNPTINAQHAYFNQFSNGRFPQFVVKLRVTDFANQIKETGDVVSFNPFRLNAKPDYKRCPDTWSYFESQPLATGGTGNYQFTWTTTSGALDFESNDPHDPNPYFKAPANGSKQYNLLAEMLNASGGVVCQLSKQITVTAAPLVIDLPAFNWPICSTGGREIGLFDLSSIGGSGNYGFEWSAEPSHLNYLSDIFSPTPLLSLSGVPAGTSITYTLTVGDLASQCSDSHDFTITSVANDHTVILKGPGSICYGEEVVLNAQGAPVNNTPPFGDIFHFYQWTTTNPHHDLSGLGNYVTNLPIDEIVSSHPGMYNYTVRYHHFVTGCSAEASLNVTIREPWKHNGYVPTIKSVVAGTSAQLWKPSVSNTITNGIQNLNNISIDWIPFDPPIVENNVSTMLPKRGMFTPTTAAPYLTMKVTDNATGCSESYKTIRYIISESTPKLWVSASNTFSCIGGEVCFDVVFDAQLANYNTSLLPQSIVVGGAINAHSSVQQQPSFKYFPVELKLVNSSGLYKGTFCESDFFQHQTGHDKHYRVSFSSITPDIWTGVESVVIDVAIYDYATQLGHEVECLPKGIENGHQHALSYNFGLTCATVGKVHNYNSYSFARDYIEIEPDGEIELIPSASSGVPLGKGALLAINPCIDQQFLSPDPDESPTPPISANRAEEIEFTPISSEATLEVFPNPFTGEVNIQYTLPSDCKDEAFINLLDITGKHLRTIEKRKSTSGGQFEIIFDGKYLPPGVYFYELAAGNCRKIKKAVKIGF